MSPVSTLRNIFILAVLIGGVYFLSKHIDSLRITVAQMLHVSPKVLGVSTKINPSDEIKQNVAEGMSDMKKQALNIKVADVLSVASRSAKIINDVKDVTSFLQGQILQFTNKK